MQLLVLDNYDSFTYNLVHIIRELGFETQMEVIRNDKIKVEEIEKYDKILLSPGPGIPDEAGVMQELIKTYAPEKSILGVCLGHQGIAEVFGATIFNMSVVLHGVATTTTIVKKDEPIFNGLPLSLKTCRYHSWLVDINSIGENLEVTAKDENGDVMALSHKQYDVKGVQFHPESILTEHGKKIIENWLSL